MTSITIYRSAGRRSETVCNAMAEGLRRLGLRPRTRVEAAYHGVDSDVAVFYGLAGNLVYALDEYRLAGKTAVHVDLGYWGRHEGGRYTGYHKVTVNDRHPTAYFQRRPKPDDRLRRLGVTIAPWRDSTGPILLAGMGAKAAFYVGCGAEEFERRAIWEIKQQTNRLIIYRPKPSWKAAAPIRGVEYSPPEKPLDLAGIYATVSRHSNVAVEGLAAGIPAFCQAGAAMPLALQDLARIETPWRPEGREQLLADLAYCQWTIREMAAGLCWRYLRDDGLVP